MFHANAMRKLIQTSTAAFIATCVAAGIVPSLVASTEPVRNHVPPEADSDHSSALPIFYPFTTEAKGQPGISPEAVLRQFLEKHTAMDYPAGAEAAMRLIAVIPERPEGHYNLACAMSRMRRIADAMTALNDAVDKGWRDQTHLMMDPDLAGVRDRAEFAVLVRRLETLIAAEKVTPSPVRMSVWPQIAADLTQAAPALQERHHVPGLAVALIHDGEVVWRQAFGVRDRRTGEPLQPDDRFLLRGPIDLMTLMACQQQHDRGLLQLTSLLRDGAALADVPPNAARHDPGHDPGHDRPQVVATGSRTAAPRLTGTRTSEGTAETLDSRQRPRPSCGSRNASACTVEDFLRLAVEMSADTGFAEYCQAQVFEPLMMQATAFAAASDEDDSPVIGHSVLGSPMHLPVGGRRENSEPMLYSTAADLASLVTQTMGSHAGNLDSENKEIYVRRVDGQAADTPPADDGEAEKTAIFIDLLAAVQDDGGGTLGLSLDVRRTAAGVRVQVSDVAIGTGCLLRWYPQTRSGIVVLFNSATGLPVAERLAHLALGGE